METHTCDVNHLDSDALLPPRKRLLAGLKKQVLDIHSPAPSTSCSVDSEFDIRLNNLLSSHLSNPNISNKEIVEASKCAAIEAAKSAEAKRANAEQKAAKAAKAVAAAKNALEIVATLEEEAAKKDNKCQKKYKTKKHVPVQMLYNKNKGKNTNCRKDEEMARNLHRAINSSPRIVKNSPGSDLKNHKHKKVKICGVYSTEGCIEEIDMVTVDLNSSKNEMGDKVILDNGNGKIGRVHLENKEVGVMLKDKFLKPLDGFGKKKGRIKQKRLPLSICSFRDQTSPKDEVKSCVGTSADSLMVPVERASMWKCQEFRAPACVSQNKVMQS